MKKRSIRRALRQIKDDTSSLHVQRDAASLFSRYTDNLSKISMVFGFDRELFISKVYERALRGSLKQAIQKPPAEKLPPRFARYAWRILQFGDTAETKDKFAREIKLAHGGFSTEECVLYRQRVRDAAQEIVLNLLRIADEQINQTNILMKNRLSTIKNELGLYWEANSGCSAELARTLRSIWACREVQAILKKKDSSFRISTRQ
jgi:hypothetical protein